MNSRQQNFIDTRYLDDSFDLDATREGIRRGRLEAERTARDFTPISNGSVTREELKREIDACTKPLTDQIRELTSMVRALAHGNSLSPEEGSGLRSAVLRPLRNSDTYLKTCHDLATVAMLSW